MQDLAGKDFKEGQLVVCKPKSESTWNGMRFGFIKKVNARTIRVVTFCKQYWSDKHAELREGNYTDIAVYILTEPRDTWFDDEHRRVIDFPEGFPEQLKQEYINEFLTRTAPSS